MPSVEQLTFEQAAGGETQNEKLRRLFLARPGEWLAMPELGELIGAFAVHSRVADLRAKHGMNIKVRIEGGRPRKSFYMYEPNEFTDGQANLGAAGGGGKVERG